MKTLLIVRHAPAGSAAQKAAWKRSGQPDERRPLTKEGTEKMREAAKGLSRIVEPPEAIATSRLTRAKQTAEILRSRLKAPILEIEELGPEAEPEALARWLAARKEKCLVLVGHEPHLSLTIAWLCGADRPFTELKKGQAACFELHRPEPGGARLLWSLAPAQLRRLA